MLKLRKKQNGPADEIIDRSHYLIPPSLFFPFSETEFKRIHVVSPPCKGILDAFVGAINAQLDSRIVIVDYSEHTLGDSEQSEAMAYVQLNIGGQRVCGAGCSEDIVGASLRAVLNAIARAGVGIDASASPQLQAV